MNWDDVRLFLTLARAGTTVAAAERLGVNQSTVSRRLKQLEEDAGVALFERRSTGLWLTEAGREMQRVGAEIEERFHEIDRQVLGRDVRLSGRIRVSLGDFLMEPLGPILADFVRHYPDIEVDVEVANQLVNLGRRDADIILRLGGPPPDHLVGRRVATATMAIYGAPSYLSTVDPSDVRSLDWVRWAEHWSDFPAERWIARHAGPGRSRVWTDTDVAHRAVVAAGVGVGFSLCRTADRDPRVRRISEPFEFDIAIWLLTHPDLRQTARVAAFMSFVGDALAAERALFENPMPLDEPAPMGPLPQPG